MLTVRNVNYFKCIGLGGGRRSHSQQLFKAFNGGIDFDNVPDDLIVHNVAVQCGALAVFATFKHASTDRMMEYVQLHKYRKTVTSDYRGVLRILP